jgi:hypothetical protein
MILDQLALNYIALRNFDAADKTLDRAIAAAPQAFGPVSLKHTLQFCRRGSHPGRKQMSSIAPENDPNGIVTWARWWLLMLQRNFPEALAVAEKFPGEILIVETTTPVPKILLKAIIHRLQGDKPKAQIEFEQARIVSENLLHEAPEDPARHAQMDVSLRH